MLLPVFELTPSDSIVGFVSDAALEEGGKVHGIIPQALTGRAAERAVRKLRSSSPSKNETNGRSQPSADDDHEETPAGSKEGTGEEVVRVDQERSERFVNEIVQTMHEVSLSSLCTTPLHLDPDLPVISECAEETTHGRALARRVHRASRRVRDV